MSATVAIFIAAGPFGGNRHETMTRLKAGRILPHLITHYGRAHVSVYRSPAASGRDLTQELLDEYRAHIVREVNCWRML